MPVYTKGTIYKNKDGTYERMGEDELFHPVFPLNKLSLNEAEWNFTDSNGNVYEPHREPLYLGEINLGEAPGIYDRLILISNQNYNDPILGAAARWQESLNNNTNPVLAVAKSPLGLTSYGAYTNFLLDASKGDTESMYASVMPTPIKGVPSSYIEEEYGNILKPKTTRTVFPLYTEATYLQHPYLSISYLDDSNLPLKYEIFKGKILPASSITNELREAVWNLDYPLRMLYALLDEAIKQQIQKLYEDAMSRRRTYIFPGVGDAVERGSIAYKSPNSNTFIISAPQYSISTNELFHPTHFAPTSLREGYKAIENLSKSKQPTMFTVTNDLSPMLLKLGFYKVGEIPQDFGGLTVMKDIMLNEATTKESIKNTLLNELYLDNEEAEDLSTFYFAKLLNEMKKQSISPFLDVPKLSSFSMKDIIKKEDRDKLTRILEQLNLNKQ